MCETVTENSKCYQVDQLGILTFKFQTSGGADVSLCLVSQLFEPAAEPAAGLPDDRHLSEGHFS